MKKVRFNGSVALQSLIPNVLTRWIWYFRIICKNLLNSPFPPKKTPEIGVFTNKTNCKCCRLIFFKKFSYYSLETPIRVPAHWTNSFHFQDIRSNRLHIKFPITRETLIKLKVEPVTKLRIRNTRTLNKSNNNLMPANNDIVVTFPV